MVDCDFLRCQKKDGYSSHNFSLLALTEQTNQTQKMPQRLGQKGYIFSYRAAVSTYALFDYFDNLIALLQLD